MSHRFEQLPTEPLEPFREPLWLYSRHLLNGGGCGGSEPYSDSSQQISTHQEDEQRSQEKTLDNSFPPNRTHLQSEHLLAFLDDSLSTPSIAVQRREF